MVFALRGVSVGSAADAARHPGPKVFGLVHLAPMPASPFYGGATVSEQLDRVRASVDALVAGGADGVLLQTSDRVYASGDETDPATVASMAVLARGVRQDTPEHFAVGVQIMRNAASASLAVAKVVGADFVRVSALVGASLSAHGWVQPDPLSIMRYRRALEAFDVDVLADVDTVHFEWAGGREPVPDIARRAVGAGADLVCIGHPDEDRTVTALRAVREREPGIGLVLAGHSTFENAARLLPLVDAACVSRCLTGEKWSGAIEEKLVRSYLALAAEAAG